MKNGFYFFIGIFAALGLSWAGIVLGSNAQLGKLAPFYDETESQSFPPRPPGIAVQGQLVYRDLNCAACHTQQVRRPDFGADQARGWGDRQSVARDYIFQPYVQLGESRVGPDLTNLAGRKPSAPDAGDLENLLYAGEGAMPGYAFLFENRKIVGQVSDQALRLAGKLKPAPGYEIVPTRRAEALVAYLLSLSTVYDYPESKPAPSPAAASAAPAAPKAPATPKAATPAPPAAATPAAPKAAAAPAAAASPAEDKKK